MQSSWSVNRKFQLKLFSAHLLFSMLNSSRCTFGSPHHTLKYQDPTNEFYQILVKFT